MAKRYIPKTNDKFRVFVKIPAFKGKSFVCIGRCYSSGHYCCVKARGKGDRKAWYAFNKQDFEFEKV